MLQFRNIARRFNTMRKASSGSGSMEVCTDVSSIGGDVDIRSNTGRYNRFDKRRRQNRLGQSLWDCETGRRTAYGKRVLKKKNKRFDKESHRHQQGEHAHTRTQTKRNQEEQQQQRNGKSFLRQYICKPRFKHVNRREYTITNSRQLNHVQHKYSEPVFNGPDENAPNATRIQRFANELWAGLRQTERKRNIRKAGHKRISVVRKSIADKKGRDRQAYKKRRARAGCRLFRLTRTRHE